MIVKQSRSQKGKAAGLSGHLLEGAENEEIHEIHGDVDDIIALSESRVAGTSLKYEMRQFIISPDRPLTPDQEQKMIASITSEMGAESFEYAVVKHVKPRADGNTAPHYHIVMPERDANGRALDKAHFKVRNEKVARLLEIEFDHELTKGTHNKAVFEHLKSNGKEAEAARMEHLTHGAPALSQFSSKAHQIAKRLGVDLPKIAQTLKPGKGEGVDFHAQQIAQVLRDHPNARVSIDDAKGHLALTGPDGTFIASLNRVGKIDRDQNDAILNRIASMNAQETPDAHLHHIDKETTNDGRTSTTARTAEAEERRNDDLGRNQGRHDEHTAEARPSVEPRSIESVPVGPASGNDRKDGRSNDRDAANPAFDSRSAERAAIRDRLSVEHDGTAPRHKSAPRATHRALSFFELVRLQNAWTTTNPQFSAISTPLADARPRSEIAGMRPSGAPKIGRISKLQEARLHTAFAPHQDYFSKHKVEPVHARANAAPRSQVQAKRPSLPSTKILLNELQKVRLNAALTEKRDALIAAAAFRKPARSEERKAVRPSGTMSPGHAAKLSIKQIRDAFATTKQLSGMEQKDAIAALLSKHGLHLGIGAKAGVITINRALKNGQSEFLGSLERFAGLKTNDADRADVISSIMSKVNVDEAKPDQIPSLSEKETDDVRREENHATSAKIWREFTAKLDTKADAIAAFRRIADERNVARNLSIDEGVDRLDQWDADGVSRREDAANAARNATVENVREDSGPRWSDSELTQLSSRDDRDAKRNAARASDDASRNLVLVQRDGAHADGLQEQAEKLVAAITQFVEHHQYHSVMLILGSSISENLQKTTYDQLTSVAPAPAGTKPTSKKPAGAGGVPIRPGGPGVPVVLSPGMSYEAKQKAIADALKQLTGDISMGNMPKPPSFG
ncbi:hypothetical protein ACFOHK_01030 [Falsigemmobacter intermedius]|uniref:Large polyvalent protein-associated domain-containing protein n=1 Tax=Falsigemmobacter intermedius TaxID=1553448 RepID=A0A451GH33_9RHOB|nr:hypothetical protein [Falsigemmobacter intermedius]RWY37357.1 hypothetical protein EP867_17380 [Falsigemmobacter intermedius]